jgi:hypothetical protein
MKFSNDCDPGPNHITQSFVRWRRKNIRCINRSSFGDMVVKSGQVQCCRRADLKCRLHLLSVLRTSVPPVDSICRGIWHKLTSCWGCLEAAKVARVSCLSCGTNDERLVEVVRECWWVSRSRLHIEACSWSGFLNSANVKIRMGIIAPLSRTIQKAPWYSPRPFKA